MSSSESPAEPKTKRPRLKKVNPAPPAAQPVDPSLPKLAKAQRFEVRRVSRAQLKGAPYNPRVIGKVERKKLLESIKKGGLVETLIWNERTGNLVGGHQRISVLDDLEGGTDYSLDVAVIDVDEQSERELNIRLNNPSLQGAYDGDLLGQMFQNGEIDLSATGFDAMDLQLQFEGTDYAKLFEPKEIIPDLSPEAEETAEEMEKIAAIKKRRKVYKAQDQATDDTGFYVVVTFKDREACSDFMLEAGFDPEQQYVDGETLRRRLA